MMAEGNRIPGVPPEGYRVVRQIVSTNALRFNPDRDCMSIAADLVTAHETGAPVVDDDDRILGFISEIDLLRALCGGWDLNRLNAEDVMTPCAIGVEETTPIAEAIQVMDQYHLYNLPVRVDGQVRYSVTRHDLLRAWVGLGLSREPATTG
jgi:predicted transcriptional regulator